MYRGKTIKFVISIDSGVENIAHLHTLVWHSMRLRGYLEVGL